MFQFKAKVLLEDTDAAGILFFANYIKRSHQVYEAFMDSIDYGLAQIINDEPLLILIVHTEADYKQSLRLGQEYQVCLKVSDMGRTSFTLEYVFEREDATVAAVKTVHVCIDKNTKKPVEIPIRLRHSLELHS